MEGFAVSIQTYEKWPSFHSSLSERQTFSSHHVIMIIHYAVFGIFHMVSEILNISLSSQTSEVQTAILVPSMDNFKEIFAIRYKNIINSVNSNVN